MSYLSKLIKKIVAEFYLKTNEKEKESGRFQ